VLSDVGGFRDVAATGAAELVPPGDTEALREALSALLGDPARRDAVARAAQRAAAGPFSWDDAAARTLALYHELAG
jgi:glycosyltransferase involved in cell wall biosynthesis